MKRSTNAKKKCISLDIYKIHEEFSTMPSPYFSLDAKRGKP
jgi:hypothetical protein